MADISHLTNLQTTEEIDWEDYPETGKTFRLPPKGRYSLRAPDSFPQDAFEATTDGVLKARIDPTIQGGEFDGFEVRYQSVTARPFKRGTRMASRLADYVRSAAPESNPGANPKTQAEAIEATAGRVYDAELDWEAYFPEDQSRVRGMENFPLECEGTHSMWAVHPTLLDPETGKPLQKRARLVIRRFIAAN